MRSIAKLVVLCVAIGLITLVVCGDGEVLLSDVSVIYTPLDQGLIRWIWGLSIVGFIYGGIARVLLGLHAPEERTVYRGNVPTLEYSGGGVVWPTGATIGGAVMFLSGVILFLLLLRVFAE